MLPTATIVFREFLEIALVLTILMAATQGMRHRSLLILAGLGIGMSGAALIAFFTDRISNAVDGVGQEIFNAVIMFIAVGFLSWTVLWMKKHGRELAQNLKQVGSDVKDGKAHYYILVSIIALSTFREGAEVVLFSYGMLLSEQFALSSILLGGLLGALGGTFIGVLLYLGLIRAAQKHLFGVTSWMLILLTAGMAAQGASFLIAADILPPLTTQLWDSSDIISGSSFLGATLGVLIGYTPRPSGMEVVFYLFVLCSIGYFYRLSNKKPVSTVAS
jgi:high-affinity iron transporter